MPVDHPSDTGTFTRELFGKAVDKMKVMCGVLTKLPSSHVQYCLLRYCLDGCRLNFLTRCSAVHHTGPEVNRADGILRETLGDVLGTPLDDSQWLQARLPQRLGGLGIRSPVDMVAAGRMASLLDCLTRSHQILVMEDNPNPLPRDFLTVLGILQNRLGPELEPLKSWLLAPPSRVSVELQHTRQHWWGDRWYKALAQALPQGLPARDQARIALQQAQRGAAWLGVMPSMGQNTELPNDEFRLLTRFWLGMPLLPLRWQGSSCPLCNQILDVSGDHMVCCNKNLLKQRHTSIQTTLADLAQLAGVPAALEAALPDGSIPGDLCFRQWDSDGPLMVDITCRHPTPVGQSPPSVDSLSSWFAAQEEDKDNLYLSKCRAVGYSFAAFVVTPWGGLGPEARKIAFRLHKLAMGSKRGWARTRQSLIFWQKLSLAVARPVARQLTPILTVQEPAWGHGPHAHNPYV